MENIGTEMLVCQELQLSAEMENIGTEMLVCQSQAAVEAVAATANLKKFLQNGASEIKISILISKSEPQ